MIAIDAIRVNNSTWAWSSVSVSVDGAGIEGVVAIDFEDKLEPRVIPSNRSDAPPLGMSKGKYQVALFPLRMLADSAAILKQTLQAKAIAHGLTSYGQATFTLQLQLAGRDSLNGQPSTTFFASCRLANEKNTLEEGNAAIVTEFSVACLGIVRDGLSLWADPNAATILPARDSLTIGAFPAPGKWTLESAEKVYDWQIRKASAMSGATVVPMGDLLVEAGFRVEVWSEVDYLAFCAFRKVWLKSCVVQTPGSVVAFALQLDHPELHELGVAAVVIRSMTFLKPDEFGVYMATVKFLQYRPPRPALSKPDAFIPDVAKPKPTAKDQYDLEIQKAQTRMAKAQQP